MANHEQKALQLMAEAKKKETQQKGFLGTLLGSNKIEEAIDCYQRAANMFKMSKNWAKAGECFCEAANLHERIGSRPNAAIQYVDASNCYKKVDIESAVNCLLKATEIYSDMGRFHVVAKHHQSIAEIYETEPCMLPKCVEHYEQASDYFRGEESTSSANKCLIKVAHLSAKMEDYEKAITIYEQVAVTSLQSSLLKYTAADYFFRAALCHLCIDTLNAQQAIQRYAYQYPAFEDSREYKLIKTLSEHLEEQDVESFSAALKSYNSITHLDDWYMKILLRIKKAANEDPDLR